ncbi:molybdate ABC transporter substrate-binding protein [Jongsikchunia kroppenstedtii]|uniref:molybdate ABC transporter substrate-binding protein n=1 Tax=Jongsikchunia kroppenstedtii TaxID=1121721 RepID=UPI000379934D|nr:molybdate ABC transporter substrate-binding protein [Jongsikchunia kroppenstedtii]
MNWYTKGTVAVVAGICAAGSVAACSDGSDNDKTTLTVFAAASLKDSFEKLKDAYEQQHPGVTVNISYDGSNALVTRIKQGATADVIATADTKTMDALGTEAADRGDFATNTLTIVTAEGNPKHIASLADLTKPGITTVLCAPPVPCGAASLKAEQQAGVTIAPVSQETSVTGVLTKVRTGQADAGIVYVTDAETAARQVDTVSDPAFGGVVNHYPIAVVAGTKHEADATAFVDLVRGQTGQEVLGQFGFGPA